MQDLMNFAFTHYDERSRNIEKTYLMELPCAWLISNKKLNNIGTIMAPIEVSTMLL